MTAVVVSLAALALTMTGAVVWLVYGRVAAADQLMQERAKHSATHLMLERRDFEVMSLKQQLAVETKRANAFEEALADDEGPALDPRDVRGRVMRAALKARAAAADRAGEARAEPAEAVHSTIPADTPESAEVPVAGRLDPNEMLR